MVNVRCIGRDGEEAIAFSSEQPGFRMEMHPGKGFARLKRGDQRLLLSLVEGSGGAARLMPDGRQPEPGAWNRIQIEVTDLAGLVETLRRKGVPFCNEIVHGIEANQFWWMTLPAIPSNSSSHIRSA